MPLGILLSVLLLQPQIVTNVFEGEVNKLLEIRVTPDIPEGYQLLDQEWLVLAPKVDYRQYEDGSVFVLTAPAGQYQARWRGQYLRLEPFDAKKEWRVYTINIRGPPDTVVIPDPVDETDPIKPLPPGKRLVVVVWESSQTRRPVQTFKAREILEAKGHQFRVIDKDQLTGLDRVPRELASAIEATSGQDLPYLVVVAADGSVVKAKALPNTASQIEAEVAYK